MSGTRPIQPINPFSSERLVYRAVNNTPEDEKFVHSIQKDAESQSGTSYGLLRPESIKASNEFKQYIAEKCLLGAIICLPPSIAEKNDDPNATGEPIGIICLKSNPPHLAHHRWTEISIDIARKHRGMGYGGEAILWSLWYAFQMAGLHRVQISAFSFNESANRLYKRLGFKKEGKQRDFMWFNGSWHDKVMYGMLENEWRDMQGDVEKVCKFMLNLDDAL
ncbi:putative GNAT family acetyltransferase [Hypoxylon sp. NC0597]|nr:putative GNAT family acetyltransferase [Hypoxylon sp. NC0597]